MSAYPITFDQTPAVERNRLTVAICVIMVIPHLIWSVIYGIAAHVAVFAAWFAIVFTGRFPDSIYRFAAGVRALPDAHARLPGARHRRVSTVRRKRAPRYPITVTIPPRRRATVA
jgi:hypothetical protein